MTLRDTLIRHLGPLVWAAVWLAALVGLAPIPDETYYWTWSRALAWTYFDHPPGIAAVLAVSTRLFGDGLAGLRAPALVGAAVVVLASRAAARRLAEQQARLEPVRPDAAPGEPSARGARAAWLVTLLLLGAPMFAVGYLPGTHDVVLGAAIAVAALAVVRAPDSPVWTAVAALVLTSSVLIKHSAALLALGVLLGLLTTRAGRQRVASGPSLVGGLLGLLLVAPWLHAEWVSGGGSVVFQAGHVFDFGPPRPLVGVPLALGSMLLTLGPVGGVGVWWLPRASAPLPAERALRAGAWALLMACVVAVVAGSGEANWPMPALVLVAPVIAARLAAWRGGRVAERVLYGSVLITGLLLTHVAWPWAPLRISRDPTLRGAGMAAVAREAARVGEAHGARLLVTRRYQAASLLRWHLQDTWPVLEVGSTRRGSQYDLWPRPQACAGDVVVWVSVDATPPAVLAGQPRALPQKLWRVPYAGAPGLEAWWIVPLELTADTPGAACATGPP